MRAARAFLFVPLQLNWSVRWAYTSNDRNASSTAQRTHCWHRLGGHLASRRRCPGCEQGRVAPLPVRLACLGCARQLDCLCHPQWGGLRPSVGGARAHSHRRDAGAAPRARMGLTCGSCRSHGPECGATQAISKSASSPRRIYNIRLDGSAWSSQRAPDDRRSQTSSRASRTQCAAHLTNVAAVKGCY